MAQDCSELLDSFALNLSLVDDYFTKDLLKSYQAIVGDGHDPAVVSLDGDSACNHGDDDSSTDLSSVYTEDTGGVNSADRTRWMQEQFSLQQKDIDQGKAFLYPKHDDILCPEEPKMTEPVVKVTTNNNRPKEYDKSQKIPVPREHLYDLPDDFGDRNLKEAISPKKPKPRKKEDYTKGPQMCRSCGQPRRGHLCFFTKVRLNDIPRILENLPVRTREKLELYLQMMGDKIQKKLKLVNSTRGSVRKKSRKSKVLPSVEAMDSFASEPAHAMDSLAATDVSTRVENSPAKKRRKIA